ncbi:hypothetical protein [Actinomycetospora termitidis]|uniref:Putative antitoxin VapB45-like DNA-binding HTH domain-containing protein n=1 Tax=Actinomycetospora termitidis TaxID=3053470 RepID=A0ABT7M1B7_9PSEU|nr:hypothetical protein [Actinomycetospora sp. Odt1-22]MDL5154449.1 hypothetical protein [Actinomycetospora sp. Odt1-22]
MTTTARDKRFDVPLYSVTDAARHIGVARSTFDTWVQGYQRNPKGRPMVVGQPVVTALPSAGRGEARIPFIGLAEGFVLAAFKEAGVPLQRIRPALDEIRSHIGLEHALASKALYTDGAEVLYDYAERQGDTLEAKSARDLVVLRSNQRVFNPVVESYLERIDFADDGWARLLHLPQYGVADVVVDPTRSFGLPIFASGAARVEVVLGRFKNGEDVASLSKEFHIPEKQVLAAIRAHTDAAA